MKIYKNLRKCVNIAPMSFNKINVNGMPINV